MNRGHLLCVLFLLVALPGAALAGLYPGGFRDPTPDAAAWTMVAAKTTGPVVPHTSPGVGHTAPPVPHTAPAVAIKKPATPPAGPAKPVVGGTQVSATGQVHGGGAPAAIGGANHVAQGTLSGSSFTKRHP